MSGSTEARKSAIRLRSSASSLKPGTTRVTTSTQNPRSFSIRIVSVTFSITPPSCR
jgi:hypothetical protein